MLIRWYVCNFCGAKLQTHAPTVTVCHKCNSLGQFRLSDVNDPIVLLKRLHNVFQSSIDKDHGLGVESLRGINLEIKASIEGWMHDIAENEGKKKE